MDVDWFNLLEAGFWLVLAGWCVFLINIVPLRYRKLALFSALILGTFGVSDLLQAHYGSFLLPEMEWLLVWKMLNVAAIVVAVLWYLRLRLTQSKSMAKSIETGQ